MIGITTRTATVASRCSSTRLSTQYTICPRRHRWEVFVHHNTLHAFQSLPFFEALSVAGRRLRARMFLPERTYRDALHRGRIGDADLRAVLASAEAVARPSDWPQRVPSPETLAFLTMRHGLHETSAAGVHFLLSETDAGHRLRPDLPESARKRLLSVQNADSVPASRDNEAAIVAALWEASQGRAALLPVPKSVSAGPMFFREPLLRWKR